MKTVFLASHRNIVLIFSLIKDRLLFTFTVLVYITWLIVNIVQATLSIGRITKHPKMQRFIPHKNMRKHAVEKFTFVIRHVPNQYKAQTYVIALF